MQYNIDPIINMIKKDHNPLGKITFLSSAPTLAIAPPDEGREVAFVGRSNSGKSSALNAIVGDAHLARTSKTPGRTQMMVFFTVESTESRLVDLPGYGYAEVPEAMRLQWGKHLGEYLKKRKSLQGIVLIMDIRHPLKELDRLLLDYCQMNQRPVYILLTKSDKLSRTQVIKKELDVRKALETWPIVVGTQPFSSLRDTGLSPARGMLMEWLGVPRTHKQKS